MNNYVKELHVIKFNLRIKDSDIQSMEDVAFNKGLDALAKMLEQRQDGKLAAAVFARWEEAYLKHKESFK